MPIDVVLVRHGQSEGNVALKRSRQGDDRDFTPEFLRRHSSLWRLTDLGIEQAQAAGAWIRDEILAEGEPFYRYYVSEYHRALETAAYLDLPEARWFSHPDLVERNWGLLDRMTEPDRRERFQHELDEREIAPYYWRPPNGESLVQVGQRLRSFLDTLHRECAERRIIVVAHGEVIEGFRTVLERMPQHEYLAWQRSNDPADRIHNGQVVWYSRRHPNTGEITPYLSWRRSIATSDLAISSPWRAIERPTYSNEALLEIVARTPRIITG
jgi:NAD+ kinase